MHGARRLPLLQVFNLILCPGGTNWNVYVFHQVNRFISGVEEPKPQITEIRAALQSMM
jgi:hypothetical protein